jgi:hypothetical protein
MFYEFQPFTLTNTTRFAKDITAAKELKTTTAKQTAHQKTRSSSVFFDIFISRDRIVSVIGHYLPIFVINACHNHICVNLCTSFLSHLSQCFTNLAKATNWVPHSIDELSGSQKTEDTWCIVWA